MPLPGLDAVGPITDSVNESVITVDVDVRADQTLSVVQITVRQTGSCTLLARQFGSLKVVAPTIAAVFLSDISAAADNWQYTVAEDDQPCTLCHPDAHKGPQDCPTVAIVMDDDDLRAGLTTWRKVHRNT